MLTLKFLKPAVTLEIPQHSLCHWFSQCGPLTSSTSISWEPVGNANSQAPLTPTESEILEVAPSNLCFKKPSR